MRKYLSEVKRIDGILPGLVIYCTESKIKNKVTKKIKSSQKLLCDVQEIVGGWGGWKITKHDVE